MAQEIADSAKGGGGLMDLIAQEQAKGPSKETKPAARPVSTAGAVKKPAAKP